ncbi:MAG: type II secretion system protein [Planctomycetes bacterium]|nr:type II secretion system protein [Planctomycetota bacterium]
MIELLVVAVIITILVALLIPALKKLYRVGQKPCLREQAQADKHGVHDLFRRLQSFSPASKLGLLGKGIQGLRHVELSGALHKHVAESAYDWWLRKPSEVRNSVPGNTPGLDPYHHGNGNGTNLLFVDSHVTYYASGRIITNLTDKFTFE